SPVMPSISHRSSPDPMPSAGAPPPLLAAPHSSPREAQAVLLPHPGPFAAPPPRSSTGCCPARQWRRSDLRRSQRGRRKVDVAEESSIVFSRDGGGAEVGVRFVDTSHDSRGGGGGGGGVGVLGRRRRVSRIST
uniref:Uncharacterized protein n=1 Tax=Aegilops tauschii subsp. strangulata TaxID=200361 RepID=A0A453SSK1_AEGTS